MAAEGQRIPLRSEADIVTVRQQARDMASALGFSKTDLIVLATAISEVARNAVTYGGGGEILLAVVRNGTRSGISVVAQDAGPGIPDLERALQDGYSTGGGLGLGLPGARRLMDEFEIESAAGKGTRITMRKWAR